MGNKKCINPPPINFNTKHQLISETAFFFSLPEAEISNLTDLFEERHVKKGQTIVSEGDVVDSFYIIVAGKAEVMKKAPENKEQLLAVLKDGDSIGSLEFLGQNNQILRTADVKAVTDIQLLEITEEKLQIYLRDKPEIKQLLTQNYENFMRIHFIKQLTPFTKLSTQEIQELAQNVGICALTKGQDLIVEGEYGNECYLVRYGKVEVVTKGKNNKERVVATLGPGSLVGELALFERQARNATVRALEHSQFFVIERDVFLKIMHKDVKTAEHISFFSHHRIRPKAVKEIVHQSRENKLGQTVHVLKNPKEQTYMQLMDEGWYIWQKMDGRHTVHDLILSASKYNKILFPHQVVNLITELASKRFVDVTTYKPPITQQSWQMKYLANIKKVMEAKITFKSVDNFLSNVYNQGGFILYTWPMQVLLLTIIVSGLIIFVMTADAVMTLMTQNKINYWFLLTLIPIAGIAITMHELAHGLTTKAFGRQVFGFGVGWYWITPIAFCNTTDMWLASPRQRIIMNAAGIYSDMLLAGIASWIALTVDVTSIQIIAWFYASVSYLNCIANLNPLLEFDGYYLLEDSVDAPSLRRHAIIDLNKLLKIITKPKLWSRENKQQLIYWSACIVYILVSCLAIMFYQEKILLQLLPEMIKGHYTPWMRLVLPALIIILAFMTLRAEVKQSKSIS